MSSNSIRKFFSSFLKKSSFGLDISDESIKFIELVPTKEGMKVGRHGERAIPQGVIESGQIKDRKKLKEILSSLRKNFGLKSSHITLSNIINEDEQNTKDYLSVFKNAKIKVKSIEHRTKSISRSILKKGDLGTSMIVDIGKAHSHIFIVSGGTLAYRALTSNAIYFLKDEISKHFLYWHTSKDRGGDRPDIKNIILSGDESGLYELAEYLSLHMKRKVEVADVWVNIADTEKNIPEITFNHSFSFAPALGLALKDFIDPSL